MQIINVCLLLLPFCSLNVASYSQVPVQTIKGKIFDRESHTGLPGAVVIIPDSDPVIGTRSNKDGEFRLDGVPVGRITLKISFVGYEDHYVNDLLVSSGKEISLNIPLKENVLLLGEVVIKPRSKGNKAMNNMATLSARTFTVEDAQRFAGGMDDPSRLAGSYAGVTPSTIDNNEIIIRGNAAKGILWKLEGVEIPAPNHLAGMFSGGGVNTMFSSNILDNSDFFTGAFPAEYGNAISGIFDMKLRSGNADKREYAFQAGTQGVDFAMEGPFVKGRRSSYLVNYRYSTFGLVQDLMPRITGLPSYSDLSLKLTFAVKKSGNLSFWSINGTGKLKNEMDKDTSKWETNMESFQYDISYDQTSSGLNYRTLISSKSYLFASASYSATKYGNKDDYYTKELKKIPFTNQKEINTTASLAAFLNHKFNSRHTNRTGIMIHRISYDFDIENNSNIAENDVPDFIVRSNGSSYYYQCYTQSRYDFSEHVHANAGLHMTYFNLNRELILEPRVGLNWRFHSRQEFSIAYGKHSRIEPLRIYKTEVPVEGHHELLNTSLKITKAHHFVVGYDVKINDITHLRVEPYYQVLYDVPVITDSSFSMLNYTSETFFPEQLVNDGTGTNVGIDITLEQFIKRGFYYLFTASVYNSRYVGGDYVNRNTKYNQNFIVNALVGKEWQTKRGNTFGLNGKFTLSGGKRESPVDYEKSLAYRYVVYDNSRIFEFQLPASYYLDFSVNYMINRPKLSHAIIIQLKNLLLQEESFGHAYNFKTNSVERYGLAIVYPYLSYKIQF